MKNLVAHCVRVLTLTPKIGGTSPILVHHRKGNFTRNYIECQLMAECVREVTLNHKVGGLSQENGRPKKDVGPSTLGFKALPLRQGAIWLQCKVLTKVDRFFLCLHS